MGEIEPPAGGPAAEMLAEAYEEIRRLARGILGRGGDRLLLQPTELANETVIRLMRGSAPAFESEAHVLATAARTIRRVLIDEVRRAGSAKRRMPQELTLAASAGGAPVAFDELDEVLRELTEVSPEHAVIVELRFTLGMTVEESATALGLSPRTLKRRWAVARTWLQQALEDRGHGPFA